MIYIYKLYKSSEAQMEAKAKAAQMTDDTQWVVQISRETTGFF